MSNRLNELTEILEFEFGRMAPDNDNKLFVAIGDALGIIHSLGENARRMLEIGLVQDALLNLGLRRQNFSEFYVYDENADMRVQFFVDCVRLTTPVLRYQYPLQQSGELLIKVRELIGENI